MNNFVPMTYSYYHKVIKGKVPKNAPTYIEENQAISNETKYSCILCGYVYNNEKESIKFEDLPNDWKCPICRAHKNMFEEIK